MSRSDTYRPVHLTAEQREALARQARAARLRADLLPELRTVALAQAATLAQDQGLPAATATRLQASISSATTSAELRAHLAQAERTVTVPSALPTPAASVPSSWPTTPTVVFDVTRLGAELRSLQRVAAGLDLVPVALAEAAEAVIGVERAVAVPGVDPTTAIARADQLLARVDEEVAERLVDAEQAAHSRRKVVAVLQDMGFRVADVDDDLVVHGSTTDGRQVLVEVGSGDDGTGIDARFTDPGTAVAATDRAADEVCEPAVLDAYDFHRRLEADPTLTLGAVSAPDRPTRGANPTRRARRSSATRPDQQIRRIS